MQTHNKSKGYPVKKIVTHTDPDPDEAGAMLLIWLYGREMFSGQETAGIEFVDAGVQPQISRKQWARRGVLPIGVWGGALDEHNKMDPELSAILLTARLLGVEKHPDVSHIVRYVNYVDTHGSLNKDDLNAASKHICRMTDSNYQALKWIIMALGVKVGDANDPDNFSVEYIRDLIAQQKSPEEANQWFDVLYDARIYQRLENEEAKRIVRRAKKSIEEFPGVPGKTLRLLVLETDNLEVGTVVFGYYKCADVLIVKSMTGHVRIQLNEKVHMKITDVIAMLNLEEQYAMRQAAKNDKARHKHVEKDWRVLRAVGTMPGGVWCNYNDMWALNGTRKSPGTPPTKLPLNQIIAMVKHALNQEFFPQNFSDACSAGKCTSSVQRQCPFYAYGLGRCRTIRYKKRQAKSASGRKGESKKPSRSQGGPIPQSPKFGDKFREALANN